MVLLLDNHRWQLNRSIRSLCCGYFYPLKWCQLPVGMMLKQTDVNVCNMYDKNLRVHVLAILLYSNQTELTKCHNHWLNIIIHFYSKCIKWALCKPRKWGGIFLCLIHVLLFFLAIIILVELKLINIAF